MKLTLFRLFVNKYFFVDFYFLSVIKALKKNAESLFLKQTSNN